MKPGLTPEHEIEEGADRNQAAHNDAERSGMHPSDRSALEEEHDQPDSRGKDDKGRDVEALELHVGFTPT